MPPTDLIQATAAELTELYRTKAASPVEALDAILARAERVNPVINALRLIDADGARAQAKASEARWAKGAPASGIDGVPVSIKELVRVAGWPHTMASQLTDKSPAKEDSTVTARLREGGAVIFAQSTSPEYGFKGVTDSPLNGVTRNPWKLDRIPGGSSGGAGAAVAAGLGPLAIGTDGGGSIRIPASATGLVGLKATFGRIPAWPASMHGDLANTGPMTRTARDCALMMNALARFDARDPGALSDDGVDYVAALGQGVKGLKVGVLARFGEHHVDPDVAARFDAAVKVFEALGAKVETITPPYNNGRAGMAWQVHWNSALQRLLQVYPEDRHGEFDPALLNNARMGAGLSLQTLVDAQVERRDISHAWNLVLADYDLVISPTLAVVPFEIGRMAPLGPDGQPNYQWACTAVFNLTRHPAISVPCGLSAEGLPIGLQIVAAHGRDALVLAAAEAYGAAAPFTIPDLPNG
jgi:aspartyl-tRNA(Asn)/glutamyl-tRNA(Gln) amidotransferase subunit A